MSGMVTVPTQVTLPMRPLTGRAREDFKPDRGDCHGVVACSSPGKVEGISGRGVRNAATPGSARHSATAPAMVDSPPITADNPGVVSEAIAPPRKLPSCEPPKPTTYSAALSRLRYRS